MMRLYTYHYLVSSLSIIMHSAKVQWFQFQVKMWRKINSPVWQTNSVSIIRDVTMETLSVSDMVVDLNILAWLSNLEHLCQFCCHKSFKIYNDKKKATIITEQPITVNYMYICTYVQVLWKGNIDVLYLGLYRYLHSFWGFRSSGMWSYIAGLVSSNVLM